MKKKTPEEIAAEEARKREEEAARELQAYQATPPGKARAAFERGDFVFQYSLDVMTQQAIIVAMVGSNTSKKTTDAVGVLNAVCGEGWDLVNGSFVFIEEGSQSRDKFLASGQNVAVKGRTMGYYLFKRCPENRRMAA